MEEERPEPSGAPDVECPLSLAVGMTSLEGQERRVTAVPSSYQAIPALWGSLLLLHTPDLELAKLPEHHM